MLPGPLCLYKSVLLNIRNRLVLYMQITELNFVSCTTEINRTRLYKVVKDPY